MVQLLSLPILRRAMTGRVRHCAGRWRCRCRRGDGAALRCHQITCRDGRQDGRPRCRMPTGEVSVRPLLRRLSTEPQPRLSARTVGPLRIRDPAAPAARRSSVAAPLSVKIRAAAPTGTQVYTSTPAASTPSGTARACPESRAERFEGIPRPPQGRQ
jgi:hypothetical protein